ncbi:MAG TPA: AMP-binding protein [Terriglobales bacterium]|jgi:acyl-CoA synthetase (AMP-forming)/AMP-acid ligase II
MLRTSLYADPHGRFLHDIVLESANRFAGKTALIDTSCGRRISYGEYGEIVRSLARGFVASGLKPGEVVAIYLSNCWEFCAAYHAATLAGGIPTLLNPSYREREVRYQLENSDAAVLVTDGPNVSGINLNGLPALRRVYTTRQTAGGTPLAELLKGTASLPQPEQPSEQIVAALPYSSGTTGLPKGVMLSHFNLVANIFQVIAPRGASFVHEDVLLCFLPLYHIYGLNVLLNPMLALGATMLLIPRFNLPEIEALIPREGVTTMPTVPPALNALCQAAEVGQFSSHGTLRWVKSGAAPLAPELARRFTSLTGILVCQGYGMTEASPVTHLGYLDPDLYKPDSIGQPVAKTDCRIIDANNNEVGPDEPGELVMCGPQFMLGYWKEPQATQTVFRDGWYWSGDIVTQDENNFFRVVDRRKEMIKYKGFPVAPAEVEGVILEHPAVRECGVVGRPDAAAGEIPVAFVALRDSAIACDHLKDEICAFVADRLTNYKQPREVRFIEAVPKTPSGKILRRELRKEFGS